ncbi:MAG: transcriptional regulator [Acidobacteria bacterium]|nr:transcriptional regulator [Acidobacteriota bacterium]
MARSNPAAAVAPAFEQTPSSPSSPTGGVPKLDRVIHERIRLGIVSALAANEFITFNDLKKLLSTTDGNLSVHARKLEEAGYVLCNKTFEGRVPKTEYRLTEQGREAFSRYLTHMESLIQAARSNTRK